MITRLITVLLLLASSLCWGVDPHPLGIPLDDREVAVNNRILAKVNGKPISVVDVMKKLDMIFYRQFPQYAGSSQARFQFYSVNWKKVLSDLIDTELILADAQECKIEVTRGEIRKELEVQFGPQIMKNLDQIDVSFDEAWRILHNELVIRQMMGLRVHMKARQKVSPNMVRRIYEKYKESNRRPKEWTYRVVTIRHPDPEKGAEAANIVRTFLATHQNDAKDFAEHSTKISDEVDEATIVTFSEELTQTEKELSDAYKQILQCLQVGDYSEPVAQESRASRQTVHRLFYLKAYVEGGDVPFDEVQAELKNRLIAIAIQKETEKYLAGLRLRYGVKEEQLQAMTPEGFEPFVLR